MNVVAFNGSPRPQGNTFQAIGVVMQQLQQAGIQTETVNFGGQALRGCIACYKCMEKKNGACALTSDPMNEYIQKMVQADGIIIGSPVYFSNVSAETKALIDRAGLVARANGNLLDKKVGAAVVVMRRAGATAAFSAINFFFFLQQMIVPGSVYWNLGVGRDPGDIMNDEEGLQTFQVLGRNMAWLLKKIRDK